MTIKTTFKPIVEFLNANANKKVRDILDEATAIMSAKGRSSRPSVLRDGENVIAYYCAFFNAYIAPTDANGQSTFTPKASTASGVNSYSKAGQNAWNTINANFKARNEALETEMANEPHSKVKEAQAQLATEKMAARGEYSIPTEYTVVQDPA